MLPSHHAMTIIVNKY